MWCRWFASFCVWSLLGCVIIPEALAGDVWSTPHPGLRRLRRTTSNQHINVLVIDLCAKGISLRATASSQRRRTPSSFGSLIGAHAVINGDFFSFSNYSTNGLAMSGGQVWPGTKDHSYVAPIAIGKGRVELPHHNNINKPQSWMKEVVSGHPTLLDDGKYVGNQSDPLCTNRHPRTAVGISKDHKKMIWAVVDGRSSRRIGMTCIELANLLKGFGAFDAVNMDGGGSSAMWIRGVGVANYPSDGRQRVVGNHLAVIAKGSGAPAHCPCKARCQGSKIYDTSCGVGDCGKFGATCVDDALGVRCASVFCPPRGKKKVCVDKSKIGDCDNGAIKVGDCAAFGAYCSEAGVAEARCVSAFCVDDPKKAHTPHHTCLPGNKIAYCNKDAVPTDIKACPSGTQCVLENGEGACTKPSSGSEPSPDAGGAPDAGASEPPATPDEDPGRPPDDDAPDLGATPTPDAGLEQSSAPDAATPDAGQGADLTSTVPPPGPDTAGGDVVVLAPPGGPPPPNADVGCQCQARPRLPHALWLGLLALGLILRRRDRDPTGTRQ